MTKNVNYSSEGNKKEREREWTGCHYQVYFLIETQLEIWKFFKKGKREREEGNGENKR